MMADQIDRDRGLETLLTDLLTSSELGYVRGKATLVDAMHDVAEAIQGTKE